MALVVTIVVLLILAGLTITYIMGESSVFIKANQAKEEVNIAKAREKLELVLVTDATIQKHTNSIYNQDHFLDSLILEKIKSSEIVGDIIIVDDYAFSIDRSVPKIGEYLGKKEELVFPKLEATTKLVENNKNAIITITALEEKNGINKIEIWQKGEKLDEFSYENIKTMVTKEYEVSQNGSYIIKAYGNLVVSKVIEVVGILPSVVFESNGSTEWKKSHTTVVKIVETEDKIVKAKYQWTNSVAMPEDNEFGDEQTFHSGDMITKTGVTGRYYLWVMLEAKSGEKVKWRSEEFCFDNEGPSITTFTATKYSATGITLSATAQDKKSGIVKFEFYIDGARKDNYTQTITATNESVTKTVNITGLTTGSHTCAVKVYDAENTNSTKNTSGTTKLYAWKTYNVQQDKSYEKKQKYKNETSYLSHDRFMDVWGGGTFAFFGNEPTIDQSKGRFKVSSTVGYGWTTMAKLSLVKPNYYYKEENTWYFTQFTYFELDPNYEETGIGYLTTTYEILEKITKRKGSIEGKGVTSNTRNTYPDNNYRGDIWYVYSGIQ